MKHMIPVFILFLLLCSCSEPVPVKETYFGVYRIISIDDGGKRLNPGLNQIELNNESYIYRNDQNGDNRFSLDEIEKNTYDFMVDDEGKPCIQVQGNPDRIYLMPDNHYDLLFVKEGEKKIILSTKYARITMAPGPEKFYGEYKIIKFWENGKILNINYLARVVITDNQYISKLDLNRDGTLSSDEISSVSYTQIRNDKNISGLLIDNSETPIWLLRESPFDLLLMNVDQWGNETVMYLKK